MTALWQWLVGLPGPVLGGVVLIGAFLSALGSFLVLARQSRISEGIRTQVEENLKQTGDNLKQTHEAITRIKETIAHILGGDSFCYVVLANITANTALLGVIHEGQYPLYDVAVRIVDLEKAARLSEMSSREMMTQADTYLNIGNIGPSQSAFRGHWELPNADQQGYNIFISARNGFVTQLLRLRRVNGEWKSATKVRRDIDQDAIVLYERIDPEFPRDAAGQVQWEEQKRPTAPEITP
jgi:hypothetical protein